MDWQHKTTFLFIPLLMITVLAAPNGWTDNESMRLHTKVDATTVSNMDYRSMRVAAEMQHPGPKQGKW